MPWRLFILVLIFAMSTTAWIAVGLDRMWRDTAWEFTHPGEIELVIKQTIDDPERYPK